MRQNLTKTVRQLLRTFTGPFDPYRPERHYMRGPGPKWQASRAGRATAAAVDAAAPARAPPEIAGVHA
jgi:hypothetical protein